MTDPRREFPVGCDIFSLVRIPRHFEEMAAEEWAYDVLNRIPISRGLAQVNKRWRIPFPTSMPLPYPPTLRPPREPAQYSPYARNTPYSAGPPPFLRRRFHQPLQAQPLRYESIRPLRLTQAAHAIQLQASQLPPLHRPIETQAPSIRNYFPGAGQNNTPPPTDATRPPCTTSTSASPRTKQPINLHRILSSDGARLAHPRREDGAPSPPGHRPHALPQIPDGLVASGQSRRPRQDEGVELLDLSPGAKDPPRPGGQGHETAVPPRGEETLDES